MKTEKGVTLTALVAYISVFMIIISMVTAISAHFYKNVAKVESAPKYVTEFNKFSMFFVAMLKKIQQQNQILIQVLNLMMELSMSTKIKKYIEMVQKLLKIFRQ